MTRPKSPAVIIGAGPAGMAAAAEAARAGLSCTLLDEAPALGGQVYRPFPLAFRITDRTQLGGEIAEGDQLRAEVRSFGERINVQCNTAALGIWNNRQILCHDDSSGRAHLLYADQLVIAVGGYERPIPFPGWTLPGVMAAGGLHGLVRTMQIRPGRRALIAGTGPLIFRLALLLHDIGVTIIAVLDAASQSEPTSASSELIEWQESLRRASIPVLFNHTIFEAHRGAGDSVQEALYGPVDPTDWRPKREQACAAAVDLICVGFGFVPNSELATLAGCDHDYVEASGGWVPVRDANMQTTVRGIFAVGDGAGIVGPRIAEEEGRIAGITIAEQAGLVTAVEAERRRHVHREQIQGFLAASVPRIILPGLLDLAGANTLLCRCEEVSLAEVRSAVAEGGARNLQAVKLLTRLGMGACQGRHCGPSAAFHLCQMTGRTPVEVGRINPRPPVKPVSLGALARLTDIPEPPGAVAQNAIGDEGSR